MQGNYDFVSIINSANDDTVLAPPVMMGGGLRHHHRPPIPISVNTTTTTNQTAEGNATSTHDDQTDVGVQIVAWIWFAVILLCFFLQPRTPESTLGTVGAAALAARNERLDVEKRKHAMETCLITKRVLDCDENGNLMLGDADSDGTSIEDTDVELFSDEKEGSSTCVICLEPFRVGETVAWSKRMECRHVFHRYCLLKWLEHPKHNDCPSCRCRILHFPSQEEEEEESCCSLVDSGANESLTQSSHNTFAVMNGLISRARLPISSSDVDSSLPSSECVALSKCQEEDDEEGGNVSTKNVSSNSISCEEETNDPRVDIEMGGEPNMRLIGQTSS